MKPDKLSKDAPESMREKPPGKVLVWDAPTRLFHWLLVASFIGAQMTADSERWRLLHVTCGYTVGVLLVFRLLWGVFGTRHARFAGFVRGPAAVMRYLRSLLSNQPEHYTGHNPMGGWAVLALLASSLLAVASGWLVYVDAGGEWLAELHEFIGDFMLLLVAVHLAGVIVSSWLHRENLVRAMVTGMKPGWPNEAAHGPIRSLALLLLIVVLGLWCWQWLGA